MGASVCRSQRHQILLKLELQEAGSCSSGSSTLVLCMSRMCSSEISVSSIVCFFFNFYLYAYNIQGCECEHTLALLVNGGQRTMFRCCKFTPSSAGSRINLAHTAVLQALSFTVYFNCPRRKRLNALSTKKPQV